MKLDASEEAVLVISDLHLGNPYSLASQNLGSFLEYATEGGYTLVVNGDGLDILQARFRSLASQSLGLAEHLRELAASSRLYYVIGNHDTALETALDTWLADHLMPFLNLQSGGLRVRVEHGHVYDRFYAASPRLYEAAGRACAPLLWAVPDMYRAWSVAARLRTQMANFVRPPDEESESADAEAAEMLAERGFDVVVLGHTHRPEVVHLPCGGLYVNSGNWLRDRTYVRIERGRVELLRWPADGKHRRWSAPARDRVSRA